MYPKLISVGFAVPDTFVMSQQEVFDRLGYTSRMARRIFERSGIDKRHFALDPVGLSWQEMREANPTVALNLSLKAVEACFDDQWSGKDLGALIFCSVTDYNTPALGYYIGRALGVDDESEFLNIGGQGCQSSLPGLRGACDFFNRHQRPALVVNTEIGTTTFFPSSDESDLENVLTNALFADGATAMLVGMDEDPSHPEIVDFLSLYSPEHLEILGYTWRDGRLKCRLDRSIPSVVPPLIADAVRRLLSRHNLTPQEIAHWAIHPGGPSILSGVQDHLGLTKEQTWASWETLRLFGNCSSATLGIVAKQLRESVRNPTGYAVGVTVGAGAACEVCLLRWSS